MENGGAESDTGGEILHKNGVLESRVDEGAGEVVGGHSKRDSEVEEVFEEAIDANLEEVEADPAPEVKQMAGDGGRDGEGEVNEDFQEAPLSERSAGDGSGSEEFQEVSEDVTETLDEAAAAAPAGGDTEGVDERPDTVMHTVKENDSGNVTQMELGEVVSNGGVELEDGIADGDLTELTVEEQKEEVFDVAKSSEKGRFSEVTLVNPENIITESNDDSRPNLLPDNKASCQRSHVDNFPSPEANLDEQAQSNVVADQVIDSLDSPDNLNVNNDCKHCQVAEGTDFGSSDDEEARRNSRCSWVDTNGMDKNESDFTDRHGVTLLTNTGGMQPTAPVGDIHTVVSENEENVDSIASESDAIDLQLGNVSDNEDALCGEIVDLPSEKPETNLDKGLMDDVVSLEQQRDLVESQPEMLTSSPNVVPNPIIIDENVDIGRSEEPAVMKEEKPGANFLQGSASVNNSPGTESLHVDEYEERTSTDDDVTSSVAPSPVDKYSSSKPLSDNPPASHPAGLGSSAPLLGPAPRVPLQQRVNGTLQERQSQQVEEPVNGEADEYDETREKLQMIRVKFLRLAHRLGQTPHNTVVAQVLYRLGLAEQLRGSRSTNRAGAFSFDRASAMAEQLEAAGQEPLDFSCTILVLGKTGVGKSATINSIFDEVKFSTDAFGLGTKKVQDIVGIVQGIQVRVIDTPGLLTSCVDQHRNEKALRSVKSFIKKNPPDIVLYLDRLDMQSRDYGDVPLLRTITDTFGHSIWFNAIIVLTHAASAPPDGTNGVPMSYEMFVTQRSHVVQQAIRQAAGDARLMNPVSLVENHSACRTNRAGQRVLPNGQVWKPQLLLLSFASKILAEANTLLKLQDNPPGKPFGSRPRVPPLPFLLSSLLQSRPQLRLPEEQFGDDANMEEDLDDVSDSDEESEYDELPPFKRLSKDQLAKLSKEEKKAYFDELEYREKLFIKKQLKEEKKRRKMLRKMAEAAKDAPNNYNETAEEEGIGPASVPVPMPDLALPTSFDADNPTHRYRSLDSSNQWLVRPVLENHGWDHDVGYDGLNIERLFVVKDKIPISFSGQVTKDKKDSNLQMEVASSVKHGDKKATSFGFEMQTLGKELVYTLRSETRFCNLKRNNASAGLSVTVLGDSVTAGLKFEDKLMILKRLRLVMAGGAMTSRGDVAYGGSLEATLRDKDYPLGRTSASIGLSLMDWHGDLAIGYNAQTQLPVGRTSNLIARANLNNRGSGQVSIRLNSSEQLQIALIALVPVIRNIIKNNFSYAS